MQRQNGFLIRWLAPAASLLLLLLAVSGGAARGTRIPAAQVDTTAWAESVVRYKPGAGTIGVNFSDPANALGPVDAGIVSLGNAQIAASPPADPNSCEALLIVNFGSYQIVDGDGDDLVIYEASGGGLAEPTWIYIGGVETGWRFVGESSGGRDPMDISGVADPSESFDRVAICDMPDGDTTIGAAPGPDIDAIAANHTTRIGLVAQAQGPGWSIDLDPDVVSTRTLVPMPVLADIGIVPPTIFKFQCPADTDISKCSSYITVKFHCGGELSLTPPGWYIYPFLFPTLEANPTLRDLTMWYREERVEDIYAFCFEEPVRSGAVATQEPIGVFSLEEGGARFVVVDERWRFELALPTADVYSEGANHFIAVHYLDSGESVVRVNGGNVEVDPTAAGEDPLVMSPGQQVVITEDGPGPVLDLDLLYLPVATR